MALGQLSHRYAAIADEIIERTPTIAFRTKDVDGIWKILYITRNISQWGYDREDFLCGKLLWSDILHPDDRAMLEEMLAHYRRRGKDQFEMQYRILTAQGESVWVSSQCTVVLAENGQEAYTDCVISHYTSALQSKQELREHIVRQEVLNQILQDMHDCGPEKALPVILDRVGEYLGVSRILLMRDTPDHKECELIYEWCQDKIFAIKTDEPFWLDYQKQIPKSDEMLQKVGMRIMNYGEVQPGEEGEVFSKGVKACAVFAIYTEDGRHGFLCLDDCIHHRVWSPGDIAFMQNIVKFLSDALVRKKAAEAAVLSQKSMRTVLDHMSVHILVVDPMSDTVVYTNKAFKRTFGQNFENTEKGKAYFRSLSKHCDRYPGDSRATLKCKSRYFEFFSKDAGVWLGMQCSGVTWVDGRRMRMFTSRDVSEKHMHEEEMRRVAYTDQLTGLPNRACCEIALQDAIDKAREEGRHGCALLLDLDDFKIINDGYGYDYGDALLKVFATYLRSYCLEGDQVFRVGGDEFLILVSPHNMEKLSQMIEGLVERMKLPWKVLGQTFYCMLSVGVVRFPATDAEAKETLKQVDTAMHEAKRSGRNNWVYYNADMSADSMRRAEMENQLRRAIADGFKGFEVYYQPIVDLKTHQISSAEALLRWRPEEGRMVSPGEFIPLTEYLGLIVPLGEYVLRMAAKMLKKINDMGRPQFCISVNLSLRQMQEPNILERFDAILKEEKADRNNLVLEVTEGIAATNHNRLIDVCNRFREQGINIAMDDFGTGYSSLGKIRDMPLDIIKADSCFIKDISTDNYSLSLVKLIVEIGHSLGKHICIEGVETSEQLDCCKAAQADTVQGFYYYRPMPAKDLEALLQSKRCAKGESA